MRYGCGVHQDLAMGAGNVGKESLSLQGSRRHSAVCGHTRAVCSLVHDEERCVAGTGKGDLILDGWVLQEVLRHTNIVWPKEQVSRVSHICGLLENALETETSKAKGEEWGP